VRIVGAPGSAEEALAWTRAAAGFAAGVPLTGFSLADLAAVAGGDHMVLAELAQALRASGLEGVADVPVDLLGDDPAEVVRAVLHGGLTARRATISKASIDARPALIERAESIQRETNAFAAFAPLPRIDPVDVPSTGYDDVKTIAITRLLAPSIPHVQVDWVLYGPKLAQVAIEYGADDIDGVAPLDFEKLGVRRSPKADIERQIRSAFADPAERNARYEIVA
jgi:aminodeoxyfutalosine synthase